jgi:hypothetical protein
MKQYRYDKESVGKNFLASYANAILQGNRLFLVNVLTDRQVLIEGDLNLLADFVLKLENGIDDEELQEQLALLGVPALLEVLFREGVIE